MVGSRVLHNQAGIAFHALVDGGFLDGPLADVGPLLLVIGGALRILGGVGRLPPRVPARAELLEEIAIDGGRLSGTRAD